VKKYRGPLIALALLIALAACALPNLYTAMQRSKQKQSLATMRDWSTAAEAYAVKNGTYPRPGYNGPVSALAPLLSKNLPAVDGWGHPILYHASKNHYALRSTARDGINDHRLTYAATTDFNDDVLYADGTFIRAPEGICGRDGEPDTWDVKKYGECSSCHPHRIAPKWQNATRGTDQDQHSR
jgi:type II secretory pathway pseudopilin PulG